MLNPQCMTHVHMHKHHESVFDYGGLHGLCRITLNTLGIVC